MTVTYSYEVANARFSTLYRLLFRWRGSIWQSIWKDLLLWLFLYYATSGLYRFILPEANRRDFEHIAVYFHNRYSAIPLTFILGFYVQFVIQRWWNIFDNLGFIDDTALQIATYVQGDGEGARMLRRQCTRYLTLAQALVLRDTSSAVKKRFPTLQHLIDSGLMTEEDYKLYGKICLGHTKYWVPIEWTCSLLTKAFRDKLITDEQVMAKIIDSVMLYRKSLQNIVHYDWVSIPLVYTHSVNIAVRAYFMFAIFAEQFLDPAQKLPSYQLDFIFPIFTVLEFIFYMGWLKVAEVHINPLGEDDDDFETNYILDKNLQTGFAIVDDNYRVIPEVKRDEFWNEPVWNVEMPYTEASKKLNNNPMIGSVAQLVVTDTDGKVSTDLSPLMCNTDLIRKATQEVGFSYRKTSQFIPTNSMPPTGHLARRRFRTFEGQIGRSQDSEGDNASKKSGSGLMVRNDAFDGANGGLAAFARGVGQRISKVFRRKRSSHRSSGDSHASNSVEPTSVNVSVSKSTPALRLNLQRDGSADSFGNGTDDWHLSTPSSPTRLFFSTKDLRQQQRSRASTAGTNSRKLSPVGETSHDAAVQTSQTHDSTSKIRSTHGRSVSTPPMIPRIIHSYSAEGGLVLSPDGLPQSSNDNKYGSTDGARKLPDESELPPEHKEQRKVSAHSSNLAIVPEDENENEQEIN